MKSKLTKFKNNTLSTVQKQGVKGGNDYTCVWMGWLGTRCWNGTDWVEPIDVSDFPSTGEDEDPQN